MPVALKAYKKSHLGPLNCAQVLREVEIHITLNHPGIIKMYAAFEDSECLYIVLELAEGGDLYKRVKTGPCQGKLPERETAKFILGPFLSALQYLHRQSIIHRDIKPENICLNQSNEVKIIDFGLAINSVKERPVTRLGTLEYMAPEVILCPQKDHPHEYKECSELTYTGAIDIWAVGVLAYELMTGKAPFERQEGASIEQHETCLQILQEDPIFPSHLSPCAISFIRSAMDKDPSRRPSVDELLFHPFLDYYQTGSLRPERTMESTSSLEAHPDVTRHASFSHSLPHVGRVYSTPSMHAALPLGLAELTAIAGSASSSPRLGFVPKHKAFNSMSCDYPNATPSQGSGELNDGRT